jgi:hypothetical protein
MYLLPQRGATPGDVTCCAALDQEGTVVTMYFDIQRRLAVPECNRSSHGSDRQRGYRQGSRW